VVIVGGRNAQPIALVRANGRKHLTKAEIAAREKSEIKLGDQKLSCPAFVKNDVVSYAKWKEITKIYKDIDFVSSGDIGLLARYCMTFSEYLKLLDQKMKIERFEIDYEKLLEHFDPELLEGLDAFFHMGPVMLLDNAINKKMDQLLKMEDRLFLNPLAKVKNVPKKEKERTDPNADLFN
jgi:phage terminase small subunit